MTLQTRISQLEKKLDQLGGGHIGRLFIVRYDYDEPPDPERLALERFNVKPRCHRCLNNGTGLAWDLPL